MSYVEIWLDDPVIGCGTRGLVVITSGRSYVTVIDPASLRSRKIGREQWRGAKPIDVPLGRVARRMRRRWRELDRLDAGAGQSKFKRKTKRLVAAVEAAAKIQ